jgi:hypothetical protein
MNSEALGPTLTLPQPNVTSSLIMSRSLFGFQRLWIPCTYCAGGADHQDSLRETAHRRKTSSFA